MFSSRPYFRWILLLVSATSVVVLLRQSSVRALASDHLPNLLSPWRTDDAIRAKEPLPLPDDYNIVDAAESEFCVDRFSAVYLENLRKNNIQYCSPSTSTLTCFHSNTRQDEQRDSMCIGKGAVLQSGKFVLDCEVRQPDANESAQGLIPYEAMRQYWYDTGPRYIFDNFVRTVSFSAEAVLEQDAENASGGGNSSAGRHFALLLKREGDVNPWHCLMEIFSMTMTFDVLSMTHDPEDGGKPYFGAPEDIQNTQVFILDGRDDGPYFDLWKLFSGREPIRLANIGQHPEVEASLARNRHRIIVPLAGASNTLWENDWAVHDCTHAALLRTFVRRVMRHYDIPYGNPEAFSPPYPAGKDIRVTFIDREGSRRLKDQAALLTALREKYPTIEVEVVNFAALAFPDQLRTAHRTDILVGIHGAGLTQAMFMREGAGAVVEIQPQDMKLFKGFRNLATMMGLEFFHTHAVTATVLRRREAQTWEDGGVVPGRIRDTHRLAKMTRDNWHNEDLEMDVEAFVDLVGVAIRTLYNKGMRDHAVV